MKSFKFGNKKISYRDSGEGKTVVLLHGFMESGEIWSGLSRELSSDYRVIVPDLPGHGESECVNDIHSMDLLAEVIDQLLMKLDIPSCIMIGHSMGGYVALAYAEQYQHKLKGLVLFHSHAAADTYEAKLNRDRTIKVIESDRKSFLVSFYPSLFAGQNVDKYKQQIEELKSDGLAFPKNGIVAALKGMKIRADRRHVIEKLNIPVLFIIGKQDSKIDANELLKQSLLPQSSDTIVLENTGHMGFIEAKRETEVGIIQFVKKIF